MPITSARMNGHLAQAQIGRKDWVRKVSIPPRPSGSAIGPSTAVTTVSFRAMETRISTIPSSMARVVSSMVPVCLIRVRPSVRP